MSAKDSRPLCACLAAGMLLVAGSLRGQEAGGDAWEAAAKKVYGWNLQNTNSMVLIFLETIRDRTAFAGNPEHPLGGPTVAQAVMERRTVLHEVAHAFIPVMAFPHTEVATDIGNQGPLSTHNNLFGTDVENKFTHVQYGIIQSTSWPDYGDFVFPPPP